MYKDHGEQDELLDAVSSRVAGIVTGYVVIVNFTDADGDSNIYCDTLEGQRCHQTLGLLAFATAIEERRAATAWEQDDD